VVAPNQWKYLWEGVSVSRGIRSSLANPALWYLSTLLPALHQRARGSLSMICKEMTWPLPSRSHSLFSLMPKVLLIDDDEQRGILRKTLERAKFEVLEADDGERGLELCHETRPDLIVVEVLLPKMLGTEVVRVLGRKYPTMKFIAISTGGRVGVDTYLRLAKVLGANRVFDKPLDPQAVLVAINELLAT
jgi:CheY-like chemotaxis protein